ncbi:VOC family protein [Sphingobium sp.]|uniref:VOC family protein n=1 Tax=Sphingobium sp. TaxID=1912891 RepID=UPI0028BE9DFF|nr:VOC family protein [Sphingobium sp.]
MSIFNHLTVGTADLAESQRFYDAALAPLGIKNLGGIPDVYVMYGDAAPQLIVIVPINGEPATFGNGITIGFKAPTRSAVEVFHAAGCASGGTCEGKPGHRESGPPGNYGAYLRDPVGNKLIAVTFNPE